MQQQRKQKYVYGLPYYKFINFSNSNQMQPTTNTVILIKHTTIAYCEATKHLTSSHCRNWDAHGMGADCKPPRKLIKTMCLLY